MKKDNYNTKIKVESWLIFAFCVILTFISLLPIYILVINSTRSQLQIANGVSFLPSTHFLENLQSLNQNRAFNLFTGFKNSFIVSVFATFFSVFFSTLTAYGLVVYNFRLKEAAYNFILLVLMIPAQVSGVGFYKFMVETLHLGDSFIPLTVPAIAAPAVVFFLKQYMESSFPKEIVEAARIDGCGEFRTFLSIGIPMIKPGMAVQAIFQFIYNWNNYFTPSMIIISKFDKKTLPLMMKAIQADIQNLDLGSVYMALTLSIVPLIVVYFLLSKYIIAGVALGGVKE
ncbi:MAG: carbohydrate ABC transporter permease [Huintestinicola sp.]